jgi:hypothetical protein
MNRPGTDQVHVLTTVSAEQGVDAILTAASSVSVGTVIPPDGAESLYAVRRLSGHLYVRVSSCEAEVSG